MKLLFAVFIISCLLFHTQAEKHITEQQRLEIKQVSGMVVKLLLLNSNSSACSTQIGTFRAIFGLLPENIREFVILEITEQLINVFPRLDPEATKKAVTDLFDKKVPAEVACDNFQKLLSPHFGRAKSCIQECIKEIDFSYERLLMLVFKCRENIQCYFDELKSDVQKTVACVKKCLDGNCKIV